MAGTTPNGTDVVYQGKLVPTFASNGLTTSQSLGTIHLWLSDDAPLPSYPVTIQTVVPRSPKPPYLPILNFTATTLDTHTLTVYKLSDALNEPAQFSSQLGLCATPVSAAALGQLTLSPGAANASYDDVALQFDHDCYYPSVSIGSARGTFDDVLTGQPPPVPLGSSPSLDVSARLQSTQTAPTLSLWLSIRADAAGGWPAGTAAPFNVTVLAPTRIEAAIEPFTDADTPLLYLPVSVGGTQQVELQVTSTCTDATDSGTVDVVLDFFFSQVIHVPIAVQCSQTLQRNPWQDLTLTAPALPSLLLYSAGRVQPPYTNPPTAATVPSQPVSLLLNFSYPASTSYSLTLRLDSVSSAGAITSAVTSYGFALRGTNNSLGLLPRSGAFSVAATTVCLVPSSLFVARLIARATDLSTGAAFDDVTLYLAWTCTLPAFDLLTTTAAAGPFTPSPSTAPNLMAAGAPVSTTPAYPFSDRNGAAQVFTIDVDGLRGVGDVALYLRSSPSASTALATPFTWSMSPRTSLNYGAIGYTMRYNGQVMQVMNGNAPSVTFTLPADGSWSPPLEMLGVNCRAPGDHVLTTFLSYGWGSEGPHAVQLDWRRSCVGDDGAGAGTGMSAGAITVVVLVLLVVAFCALGCVYNHGPGGKRGWAVVPGHEWWMRFQDRVLGPKRYTSQLEEEGEEVEIPTSSIYGTYQGDL